MRHKKAPRRVIQPDILHNNLMIAKLINRIMIDGKKSIAEKVVYNAFIRITDKNQNPVETFEKALQNVAPKVEVKARRVGGASYQVPQEVRTDRKTSLALRWLIEAARKRSNKEYHTFDEKLAAELLDAGQNQGEAVRKKDIMHKQADANKAFTHFRW
ncbi:30S ribosomal protein S7 [soil metagenome]